MGPAQSFIALAPAALLAALLLIAAVYDLRHRIIPNWLNLTIALAAPLAWIASGIELWPDLALQVGLALLVFAAFVGLFFLGGIGGGDVKMIGALALWLPTSLLLPTLLVMAIVGGAIAAVMLVIRWWRRGAGSPELPYGVAIAAAGLWAVHQQYLNHSPFIALS